MSDPLRPPETDDEPTYWGPEEPEFSDARGAGCALMIASALLVVIVAWRLLEAAMDAIRRMLR